MATTVDTLNVTVTFDPTTNPQFTYSGDIDSSQSLHFTDDAAIVTLTLTSPDGTAVFPTLLDNQQNAIVWSNGPQVQTAWSRPAADTVILTAINSAGLARYPFTVYVNYGGQNYPSPDPTIENTPVGGPSVVTADLATLQRAA